MTLNLVGQLLDYHGNSAKLRIKTTSLLEVPLKRRLKASRFKSLIVDYAERTVERRLFAVLRQQFPEWSDGSLGEKEQNLFAGFNLIISIRFCFRLAKTQP